VRYVSLGASNLRVSTFCLGTMMFGGKTDPAEASEIIHQAVDAGINFIDTADVYNAGRSEEIVGQAIAPLRDRVILASKVGMQVGDGPNDGGVSRYHIVHSLEASLRRLGTDRIDLYYVHWPSSAMNLQEMLRALEDLVRQGKVLYLACSNFPAWLFCRSLWLAELQGYAPLIAGQYPYNLIERGVEVEILPMAAALKLGIVAYRPLSAGVLTGKYLQGLPGDARGQNDERLDPWTRRYAESLRKLASFAAERGYTAGDAALAWLRSHPVVAAPIVGLSRIAQLQENLRGWDWELTAAERQELGACFPTEVWEEAGGRFPAWRRSYDIVR
jgi:1-deoxyxylulose-5-phosphate synthase